MQGDTRSHHRTTAVDSYSWQDAGADALRFHLPRDQREGASPHREEQRQGQVRNRRVTTNQQPEEIPKKIRLRLAFFVKYRYKTR